MLRRGLYKKILGVLSVLLLAVQTSWATPTGLNNIPTTDVVPNKTLVLQGWTAFGKDKKPFYATGFKYGILDKIELGLDSKFGSEDAGPIAFQGKLRLFETDFGFAALLGTEGIAIDERIGDKVIPYAVTSQDLKIFRLHGGYGFQKDNFGVFGGIDRTLNVFDQDLILRSDIKQVNDGKDLLISAGFLLTLPFNFALESWIDFPTESGKKEDVIIKLNYIIKF